MGIFPNGNEDRKMKTLFIIIGFTLFLLWGSIQMVQSLIASIS